MIDFIKISLNQIDINKLESRLDFKSELTESTGEVSTKKIAKYHHCNVVIYGSGLVLFSGSIHKMYNSLKGIKAPNYHEGTKTYKGFNGNQFTVNNIFEVRQHLETLFNCKAKQMQFQNMEFGVNTTPVFNPNLYLKGLVYHFNKPFEFSFSGNFVQATHQRYRFKIYNKSNQYGMS